jgi:phage anti-repressor protein
MSFLQLADNYSMLAQNRSENYIFIPAGYAGATKDMNVREDYFDNLSDAEYMAMIQELAPFQSQGLSAIGIGAVAGARLMSRKI